MLNIAAAWDLRSSGLLRGADLELLTFRDNLSVQYSRTWTVWHLQMDCPETSVPINLRRITSLQNEDLIYTVAEAWNHCSSSLCFCLARWMSRLVAILAVKSIHIDKCLCKTGCIWWYTRAANLLEVRNLCHICGWYHLPYYIILPHYHVQQAWSTCTRATWNSIYNMKNE